MPEVAARRLVAAGKWPGDVDLFRLGIDCDSIDVHDVGLRSRSETLRMQGMIAFLMVLVAPVAQGYTAEELVAKNIEARGGIEKIHAIESIRLTGKLTVNGGMLQLDYVSLIKRPQSVRYEAKLQGLTQVQAFDGSQAWQINPFLGRKDPEKLSADDAKGMGEDAADVIGALVDYKEKSYRLDSLGTEDVDGTEAYKLRVTRPNGDLLYVYLDPDYFLEIRTLSRRVEHGVPNETMTDYGDYEKINGVYMPLSQESGPKSSSDRQKIQFDTAEVNVAIDEAVFPFSRSRQSCRGGERLMNGKSILLISVVLAGMTGATAGAAAAGADNPSGHLGDPRHPVSTRARSRA